MTTVDPTDYLTLGALKDRESLQLVGRILEAQRLNLEAQLTQTKQIQEAIKGRLDSLR
jgi:hypothetical protein